MTVSPGAVSAVACGIIIPGICAGTAWLVRASWRWVEQVGRAQDDD